MGRRQEKGRKKGMLRTGQGEDYWLASLCWSRCCDMLLEGLCCAALHHQTNKQKTKQNGKIIGHETTHSQNSADILCQSGTLFTKAYTYANQRHTVHTIYTHTETHSHTHTDSRVVREITVV